MARTASIFSHPPCQSCGVLRVAYPLTICRLCNAAQRPQAERRVTWTHFKRLLDYGIPARDLISNGRFTFGVLRIQGREVIITDSQRLRSWLPGSAIFPFPNLPS